MKSRRSKLHRVVLAVLPLPLLALFAALVSFGQPGYAAAEANSCEDCHSNPDFLVQNKQLFDYYRQWESSIHWQEGVTCEDCHGGNAEASDKDKAHGDGVKASDPASGIYYKNIPDTCGACHEEILEGFRKSNHFEHLDTKKDEPQGPTCVTCHGAINSEILNVNSVTEACARCHNAERKNHPDHPEKARAILNRFLSIHRFYRYIAIRAEPEEARAFFQAVDALTKKLVITWHTFDLEKIDQGTTEVLALLKAKRDQIRIRRQKAK
jgi:hypothetical protein